MTTTLLFLAAILVILADDMVFSELGCYGGEILTPTIDRLAAEGVRFSRFYNCSVCGLSRAALMTGCQPWRVGQPPGADIFAPVATNCATRFLGSAGGGPAGYFRGAAKTPSFQDGRRFERPEGAHSTDLITDLVARFIEGSAGSHTPFFA